MNTHTHPDVARYLDELAALLADLDPVERGEVLAGVREHVDAALSATPVPGDAEVAAVLAGLGDPSTVAREAYDGSGARPGTEVRRVPWSDRGWVPVVVALLQLLGVLWVLMVSSSTAVVTVTSSEAVEPDGTRVETSDVLYNAGDSLTGMIPGAITALPLWLAAALLVGLSTLWTRHEKLLWLALVPACALAIGGLPELGWAILGTSGLHAGALIGLAVALLGGGWLMWSLARRGRDRAIVTR